MNEINWETIAGISVFIAALITLAYRAPSLYFGQSILCLFMVSSASLAAYVHGVIFGAPLNWVTPAHLLVMRYSIFGSIVMIVGILIAWNPRKGERKGAKGIASPILSTPWINESFGWCALLAGSAAMFAERWLRNVATVSTAVHTISDMSVFGLLVLLACGLKTRSYKHFALALVIYMPAALMATFASGHTPAKVSLLLPALCLVSGVRKINVKSVVIAVVGGFVFLSVMTGWMQTRSMIRRGELSELGFVDQVQRFIPAWYDATIKNAFDSQAANTTIRDRVDMTHILAMQVRHQPNIEPYAHGSTVTDAFITLIPRAVWPSKPVAAGGARFVMRYTGMRRDPHDTTSIGLPYQFELYANAGPICVVIGLFVVGYVCGAFERSLFTSTSGLGSLLARISMTMTLCEGGQRTDVVLPSLIAGGLTFYAIGKTIEWSSPALTARLLGRQVKQSPKAVPPLPRSAASVPPQSVAPLPPN